jgi:nitroimidazol reductase NimA-like FMN-containing flavoprotein (pyridoxamine 5'-phosphate oxidase superfamily)
MVEVTVDLAMSRSERESFLSDVHVGILGVDDPRDNSAPLLVPVWYVYEPGGDVVVQTGRDSVKAQLIHESGRFSFCVQDESPYRYVSVEGPVVAVEDPVDPAQWEAMAHRYLDPVTASAYLAANRQQLTENVSFRMRPQRWRTADFSAFTAQLS